MRRLVGEQAHPGVVGPGDRLLGQGLVEVLKPGGGEVSAGLGREFSIRPTPKAPLSTKNQGRIPVSAYP